MSQQNGRKPTTQFPDVYAWLDQDDPLLWRHNDRDGVSNHQAHDCLLNRLFRRRSKKTSKLRVTGLCAGNSPVTGEFPAQMASNAEKFPFDDVIMWTEIHEDCAIWALKRLISTNELFFTDESIQQFVPANIRQDIIPPLYCPFVREIPCWPMNSPQKGTILRCFDAMASL